MEMHYGWKVVMEKEGKPVGKTAEMNRSRSVRVNDSVEEGPTESEIAEVARLL